MLYVYFDHQICQTNLIGQVAVYPGMTTGHCFFLSHAPISIPMVTRGPNTSRGKAASSRNPSSMLPLQRSRRSGDRVVRRLGPASRRDGASWPSRSRVEGQRESVITQQVSTTNGRDGVGWAEQLTGVGLSSSRLLPPPEVLMLLSTRNKANNASAAKTMLRTHFTAAL